MICTAILASFLVFGDSRCYVSSAGNPPLPSYLAANCPGATIYSNCNPGRGVFVTGWGTTPPDAALTNALATQTPDACLLMLGLNDWTKTPEEIARGLQSLGEICIAYGAEPIIVTAFPSDDVFLAGRGGWNEEIRWRQIALATALGWRVIDSYAEFDQRTWRTDCTTNPATGTPDGVHPYAATCKQRWADYVSARLP